MHANVEFSNFNGICRFCLTEIGFLNIGLFTKEDRTQANFGGCEYNSTSESLKEMVKLCIGMDISPQDNLPQSMCTQCLDKLLQCNKFRLDCFNAEKILKNALLIHKIIKIDAHEEYDANADDVCNNEEGEQQMEIEDELSSISSGATDLDEHEIINSRTADSFQQDSGQQINENCKSHTSNAAINSMKSVKTKIGDGRSLKNVILKKIGDKTDCITVESYQTSEMQESVLNSESDVTTDSTDRFETETENSCMPEGELTEKTEAESMSFLNERFQTSEMQESVLNEEYAVDIRGNTEIGENVNSEVVIDLTSDISQLNERKSSLRKRYECLHCKKKFIHEADYKEHIKIGCYGTKCSFCKKRFLTKMKLKKHLSTNHPTKAHETEISTTKLTSRSKKRKEKTKNICRLCGVQFLMKSKLEKHFDINHPGDKPYKCSRCYKVFEKRQSMGQHTRKITCFPKTNLCCNLCKVQFPTPLKLEVHSRIHNPSLNPYKCEFCNNAFFNNLANLKKHKRCKCPSKILVCRFCLKRFTMKSQLINHWHTRHPSVILYECSVCYEVFETLDILNIHEKSHDRCITNEFSCRLCQEQLPGSREIKKHFRLFHISENPYKCDVCNKEFKALNRFKNHTKSKTCYRYEKQYDKLCRLCGKKCSTRFELKTHFHVHHPGAIPYKCVICVELFEDFKLLEIHEEVHK